MIRMVVSKNADGAIKYFTDALSVGDYYAEGQKCQGLWHGKGAWLLELMGPDLSWKVTKEQFTAMALNRHPTKGGPLTQRTVGNRRVGYDINFHPKKSVSIIYGLTRDERILTAFRSTVNETMTKMESEMKTRVRSAGADMDRTVGNLCWAEFIHFTARPVDGYPDPQLHAHCYTFNSVYDDLEEKWKAGQFGDLKRDAPFFEAYFHARLASKLVELGYEIERRGKSWEISSVPQEVVTLFSRRTTEINAKADELGIHDDKRKSELGAKTRQRKNESIPLEELSDKWASLLDPKVKEAIIRPPVPGRGAYGRGIEKSAEAAIDLAISTVFDRRSVVSEREFLTATMKTSVGSVPLSQLENQVNRDSRFIHREIGGQMMVTTKEVMAEEERMIAFARNGRGTKHALCPGHVIQDKKLNDQQRAAVMDVLNSTDRVTLIEGGAGTGKTTLIKETVKGIEGPEVLRRLCGESITFLAPSADASRGVLRSEGFATANTVAKFLLDEKMQDKSRGSVIWVDEAGLLGSRTMAALCAVVERINARLILSGDRGQHRAVERGDPLGLFVKYAGVKPITVNKVLRQRGLYKSAVEHLASGDTAKGFEGLQRLGSIREMDEGQAHKEIAWNYSNQIEQGSSALVVSPTHAEGARVTKCIREELKRRGIVKGDGETFDRLEDLRLTDGEKGKAHQYEKGNVVQFHQNISGFAAGARYTVTGTIPGIGVMLNHFFILPLDKASSFNVYRRHEKDVELCVGDTIRITANGKTLGNKDALLPKNRPHAINNGATYKVSGFTEMGNIVLENGWIVDRKFEHFTHGYCSTSHSSQGKTVNTVFIAQWKRESNWGPVRAPNRGPPVVKE